MAEWLYEAGIGEARAALIADGAIIEAVVEHDDGGVRAGTVLTARLTKQIVPGRRGLVAFDGGEALLSPLPSGVTEGAALLVRVVREAIAEPGHPKRALARPAATRSMSWPCNTAPSLRPPGRSIRASRMRPSSTKAARASPIPAS